MVYLLSSLLNSIQMLLYMFFMNAFFVRRHNSRLFWGYWLLWALIATVATNVFPSSIQLNGPFVFLMEIVILYGMNVTLYYGRWDRRLFTVVTSYAAIYSISSLMETLLLRITHMTRAEYLNNAPLYILFSPTSIFLSVENSSLPVAIVNDHIATTKQEPELHGFGLHNVMETLHKYDAFHLMSYKNSSYLPDNCYEFVKSLRHTICLPYSEVAYEPSRF